MRVAHLIDVVEALNGAGVRYLIVGGLAVNAHGYLRYTNDVDLVIQLDRMNLLRGLGALESLGYRPKHPVLVTQFADAQLREQWIVEKGMLVFPLWCDVRLETPIDVFVREPFDFAAEWGKATRCEISEGVLAPFVCLSTLYAMKRQSGRPQDLADISQLQIVHDEDRSHE